MRLLLLALMLITLAAAQADKSPTVYINGTPIKGRAVTVDGKPYVALPVSELQKSGALVAGGSVPVGAIQGCLGQPLFNGVVRITLLSAGVKDSKYVISFKVANGAQKNLLPPTDAAVNYDYMFAASADGQVQKFDTWDEANTPNHQITPGANLTANFVLNTPPAFTVTRILFRPDADTLTGGRTRGLPFAPVSNMEFALKCK
ncbi:hypothetical protein [Deinococcus sp.]|uniref:hypothetical protein n=1 Tax=Deinococcus sp. TaxID=47478 RepID=UPI0025FBFED0|nr:hypothetical protein [Deinococcus sp.]